MNQSFILTILPAFIAGAVFIAVIFTVVAIFEGRQTASKGKVVRHVYFYLVAMLTLMITVTTLGFILELGLKSVVFKGADNYDKYNNAPPYFMLSSSAKLPTETTKTCASGCELTADDKTSIQTWVASFKQWQESQDVSARRQRDLVACLSVLLVAVPLFIIHFRIIQRENAALTSEERANRVIRPTYFYIASFIGLGMIIIFGSMLINQGLKTTLFPKANQVDLAGANQNRPFVDSGNVSLIQQCGQACQLPQDQLDAAQQYQTYQLAQQTNQSSGTNKAQSDAALYLAYTVVAIPLFWYHWARVRKESKEHQTS